MFCPVCRYDYNPEIRVCPDCGVELIDELPPKEEEVVSDVSFVPLPNLPGRVYAEMVKGALEERNIPCYIRAKGVGDAYQFPGTTPMDGVQLYVPEDRLEECIQIQHRMLDHI